MSVNNGSSDPMYSTVVPRDKREDRSSPPTSHRLYRSADSSPSTLRSLAASNQGSDTSQLRLQYLENMLAKLTKEKSAMEVEFSKQRKQFMNQMMITEDQLTSSRETIEKYSKQLEVLKMSLREKEDQLSSRSSTTSVIQAYDNDRQRLEEEIDYLKKNLQMAAHESRVELERLKAGWAHEKQTLEKEKAEAIKERLSFQHQLKSLKRKDDGGDRRKSPVPPQGRKSPLPKDTSTTASLLAVGEDASLNVVNFNSEKSLEQSMIRAAEDAKLLQSVVVPLEGEIELLKMKLREAQERLEIYEGKGGGDQLETPLIEFSLPSVSPSRSPVPSRASTSTPTANNISEAELLEKLLNQERTARHDLEMHIEGLRRQKTLLLEDVGKLKEDMKQVKDELKVEQDEHKALCDIWEKANIAFLSSNEELQQQIQELKAQQLQFDSSSEGCTALRAHTIPGAHAHARGHKRSRSISWSEGVTGNETGEGGSVWKEVVQHLQRLLKELRNELSVKETLCTEYEGQLERVQLEMSNEIDSKTTEALQMRAEVSKVQAALIRERKGREELRKALIAEKEEMKTRIEQFQSQEIKMRQKMKAAREKFIETKHEVQQEMVHFTDERIRLHTLVNQQREENEMLKSLQATNMMEYKKKLERVEAARRESEFNVASTFEELSKLRKKEETVESTLSSEIADLQQLLTHSRKERQKVAEELVNAREEIGELQRRTSVLEREKMDAMQSRTTIQEKSKAFIEDQQQQIFQLTTENKDYKSKLTDLQKQMSVLKEQLKNSESVQKDFVQLSQSLQVRLVELEETERGTRHELDSVNNSDSSHVT